MNAKNSDPVNEERVIGTHIHTFFLPGDLIPPTRFKHCPEFCFSFPCHFYRLPLLNVSLNNILFSFACFLTLNK